MLELQVVCRSDRVHHVKAVELLSQQYFFTSPKLAALSAEAEVLAQASSKLEIAAAATCKPFAIPGQHLLHSQPSILCSNACFIPRCI